MDAAIEHMFDPHGLIQRNLSILQSSPAALDVSARHPHKVQTAPCLTTIMNAAHE
jgi:hypothetical protein